MRCDDLKLYDSVHSLDFHCVHWLSFKVTVCVCVTECSDGGNGYMGAAHGDSSQGECKNIIC